MSGHTPGPWSWCDQERITGPNSSRVFHEIVTNGKDDQTLVLAEVDGFRPGLDGDPREWLPEKENDANARLMAAAPDLLQAALLAVSVLGHMARVLGQEPEEGTVIPMLRASIAKAEGR